MPSRPGDEPADSTELGGSTSQHRLDPWGGVSACVRLCVSLFQSMGCYLSSVNGLIKSVISEAMLIRQSCCCLFSGASETSKLGLRRGCTRRGEAREARTRGRSAKSRPSRKRAGRTDSEAVDGLCASPAVAIDTLQKQVQRNQLGCSIGKSKSDRMQSTRQTTALIEKAGVSHQKT